MASTQRQTRRTSARADNENDDMPPAKKQKVEGSAARTLGKQANSKKAMASARTANNRVYDQTQDEFTYSLKTKKKAASSAPLPNNEAAPPKSEKPSAQSQRSHKRTSKSLEPAEQAVVEPEPRRRSKRLSGETAEAQSQAESSTRNETHRGRERERPPDESSKRAAKTPQRDQEEGLRVEKKRRETKIALPFADTPIIQRNREMRHTSAENRRRSSSTMRGRRASSLIESGTSNTMPHTTIQTSEFYKHISQNTPEPRRMALLLIWCGSRALTNRPSDEKITDVNAVLAARTIQEEILKDFTNKSEMTDWYSREDEVKPAVLVKKPNPRNQQNAAKLDELEAEVQRLEQEKAQWDELFDNLSSHIEKDTSTKEGKVPLDVQQLDSTQVEPAKLITNPESSTSVTARTRFKTASKALEFKIDTFADAVHRLKMLGEVARESAGEVMQEASKALEGREDLETARHGSSKESVGDILRALSRTAK